MIQIPKRWEQWGKTLLAAVISGGANALSAPLGIGAANAVGAGIKPLDFKELAAIAAGGGLIGAVMYLKQSPVPPDSTGNTEQFTKPPEPAK